MAKLKDGTKFLGVTASRRCHLGLSVFSYHFPRGKELVLPVEALTDAQIHWMYISPEVELKEYATKPSKAKMAEKVKPPKPPVETPANEKDLKARDAKRAAKPAEKKTQPGA